MVFRRGGSSRAASLVVARYNKGNQTRELVSYERSAPKKGKLQHCFG